MYFLGIDMGSSSVKLALVDAKTGKSRAVVQRPQQEMPIQALQQGWAEQDPLQWFTYVCQGIQQLKQDCQITEKDITGVGIAYQMHGLVLIDAQGNPLRPSIIWCDSRAVAIGDSAYTAIGPETCNARLLNSPANFTAAKLRWVQENEPDVYKQIHKWMLPGDFLAYMLSGECNTTISGLSEGVFWDFQKSEVSQDILNYFGFSKDIFPNILDTFALQSKVSKKGAAASGLQEGTPILYRAGDQPNNALSLNVLDSGEVASTGGTSGVVYAVTHSLSVKECARVNNFAHVNYAVGEDPKIGKLLCLNGAGIQYRWLFQNLGAASYKEMNHWAGEVEVGADGLCMLPFGNGAERMLGNKQVGSSILNLDLNRHTKKHLCRAALEGIAFSFVYGMEIMKSDGLSAKVIKAGNDNLYRSELFSETIATLTQKNIEIYNTTGAIGAARACAITLHGYGTFRDFLKNDHIHIYTPKKDQKPYLEAYGRWKKELERNIK